MIETQYFKINPRDYVRSRMMAWLMTWSWAILIPLSLLIFAGLYDMRFYIVAMMLVFLVYPFMVMLIYFNHALSPTAAMSVIPHKLKFTPSEIEINYEPSDERLTPQPQKISVKQIKEIEDTGSALRIHLRDGKYDFIEVPITAFAHDDACKAQDMLRKGVIIDGA